MHKMGVRSFIDPVPSIFLGTSDIKLEEMVGAYGTFAKKAYIPDQCMSPGLKTKTEILFLSSHLR